MINEGLRESVRAEMSNKNRMTYWNIEEFQINLLNKKLFNSPSTLIERLCKIRSESQTAYRNPFWTVNPL
jgi:hypothetical protein